MRLQDRVALITGGAAGIGAATARRFAEEGAVVVICDVNEAGEQVAKELGGQACFYKVNVAERKEVDAWVQEVVGRFGRIDILVNNAGITRDGLALRMKDADWRDVLDTNLSAAFYLSRAALRHLLRSEAGRIVNVSSVVALRGNAGQANYVAAKAGLVGLTKALAREYGGRGVTVNAVAPGFIASDMTDALPEDVRQRYLQEIPAGRFGTPGDVAHAVAFLVSREAGYVNGQTLAVDGGMVMP